jgi:hypothetical protein
MATYQYSQSYGYSQQQADGVHQSSTSDQQQQTNLRQHHQQQHHPQQQQQSMQSSNGYYGTGNGHDSYYGFTDSGVQLQQQNQLYFGQSSNGLNHMNLNGHNGHANLNGNNDHGFSYSAPQAQFMPSNYDPFELGVPTGTGMFFNPALQYMQQHQYYPNITQPQQTAATTNYLHRPTHETNNISPNISNPGSARSSHVNLHSITPDRASTHTPEDDQHSSPVITALAGVTRTAKQKDGPVKAACLSCRQKKAKCDGIKPICTQVSTFLHV